MSLKNINFMMWGNMLVYNYVLIVLKIKDFKNYIYVYVLGLLFMIVYIIYINFVLIVCFIFIN